MKKLLSIALLTGGLLFSGCGDSENFVFTNTNPALQLPIAVDDPYQVNQNQQLTRSAVDGVLANDTLNGGMITAFDASSTGGGTVVLNADGSFTYTPPVGFSGPDTFTYTLTNAAGSDTATVMIAVQVVDGFFVDAVNGNDATGSFTGGVPFQTIQAAVTAAGTNQDIIVRPGTYTQNVTLLDGQQLLGSGSTLINAQSQARPVIDGAGITLADDNTIDFIRIQNTPGDAIFGNGSSGITISDCEIADLTNVGSGVRDDRATGNWTITGNNITGVDGIGINFAGETGDNLVARIRDNIVTGNNAGAIAFSFGGTSTVRAQVVGNTMTGTVIPGATFEVNAGDTTNMCFDITGNVNDDAYDFARGPAATLAVEQLSQLTTLNSGGATVPDNSGGSIFNATEVPDGTCGF